MNPQPESGRAIQLFHLIVGYRPSIAIHVAAQLDIPDLLAEGPKSAEDLARASGSNADALYRVLRLLAMTGVFREIEARHFENTPLSELLRRDHPGSLRDIALWMPDPFHLRCYANLMHSVRTGETAVEYTFGKPLFEYLRENPAESALLNGGMVAITGIIIPAILEAYDFTGIRKLVDVGGGLGSVVAAILRRYPDMRGVLFDLDHVVANAGPTLEAAGVADRCEVVAGNFFESVPPGADAYIMKHVIHDWEDERCRVILKNTREALGGNPEGRLLLLEWVISAGNDLQFAKSADIEMLTIPGGRERTEAEHRALLASAGFEVTRIVAMDSPACLIEARAAT